MPYDVPVRQYLQGKGVADSDIGYDKNSGNVTVRGQNFYKPELNMANTTYSNQNNLDNAYSNYSKSAPVIQSDGSTGTTANTGQPTGQPTGTPQTKTQAAPNTGNGGYSNPYTSMIADVMKHLTDSYNAPQQDIYSSPQYAAAKANQDRQSADAIRRSSEAAAGAGLGHSTIMTDRTQHIQDDSNNYLTTQLIPQIQAQMAQQKQQEIQNQQNQLNNYMTLGQQADSQHNNDRNFEAGRQDAQTAATGIYNPSGLSADQANQEMAQNSAEYATATPERQQQLHDRNLELGQLLGKTFDSGKGTYSEGQGYAGTKTIQAKQLDSQLNEVAYNHARDSLLDKRYEDKFNQDIKQQGFENALKIAVQEHQISQDAAQLAISQQNADTASTSSTNSNENMKQDNLMNIWKATGKAPAGIAGVSEGSAYAGDKPTVPPTAETYSKYLDSVAKYTKDDNGNNVLSNPEAVESAILTSGLSEYEMFKSYKARGLTWGGPIPSPGK